MTLTRKKPASVTPAAAAATSTPLNAMMYEREWPVRVYRQISSSSRGTPTWQRMMVKRTTGSSGNTNTTNSKRVVVKVAPRKDCIVLRRLQIRLRLVVVDNTAPQHGEPPDSTTTATTTTAATATTTTTQQQQQQQHPTTNHHHHPTNPIVTTPPLQMMVTRRKDRILIASNQRLKVLLLQFRSERDCLAFADQLVALNPPQAVVSLPPPQQRTTIRIAGTTTTTASARQNQNDNHSNSGGGGAAVPAAAAAAPDNDDPSVNNKNTMRRDVLFYVSRLLHDPAFVGFCRRLEASLESTPDGMRALEALTTQETTEPMADASSVDNVSAVAARKQTGQGERSATK